MNIEEYVDSILDTTDDPWSLNWHDMFVAKGYYQVNVNNDTHPLPNLLQWCDENIGIGHYTWEYTRFWFETEEDAVRFALKFS